MKKLLSEIGNYLAGRVPGENNQSLATNFDMQQRMIAAENRQKRIADQKLVSDLAEEVFIRMISGYPWAGAKNLTTILQNAYICAEVMISRRNDKEVFSQRAEIIFFSIINGLGNVSSEKLETYLNDSYEVAETLLYERAWRLVGLESRD